MKKEDMEFYWSIGICPYCRTNPVEPNRKRCYECLGYERDRYHRLKTVGRLESKASRSNDRKMTEYYQRKDAGICTRCGKKPKVKGLLCSNCYGKFRSRQLNKQSDITRSERPDYGLCYICGEPLLEVKRVCGRCYAKRIETITSMLNNPDRRYFQEMNRVHFEMMRGGSVGK